MKKLSNIEAELKKSIAYKKKRVLFKNKGICEHLFCVDVINRWFFSYLYDVGILNCDQLLLKITKIQI